MLGAAKLNSIAAAASAPAVVNAAVTFDGTGDYYSATGLTTTATDGKFMTLAFTFYLPSSATGSFMDLLAIRLGTTSGETGYHAVLQSTRLHSYFINNSGSNTGQTYGDYEITTSNAWHQIVYYHDANAFANCKYYVDGVDRTANLLNGPSFGEPAMANVNFNWGSSNVTVKIGDGIAGFGDAGSDFNGRLSQLYIHNASGAPDISKYWDTTQGKPKDLGTNGTSTGLAQPLIYHYGTTSTFPTNNGTGFNSYTLSANGGVVSSEGPTYATPTWQLYSASTSETQANWILDGQLAVMGYNSNGTIRAAYTGNSTSSTQGFIKPILFNPSTGSITFGTKVNCMQYTSAVIYGLKTVSETEYNIGSADATNYGVTYLPNNNSPGSIVSLYPFSMDSTGAVTVGTSVALPFTNVGTADRATDIAYDGTYSGTPRYTVFSRYDAGTANQIAVSRSGNALSITRSYNGNGPGNRATISGSFAGIGEASSLMSNGNGGDMWATTWGTTTRQSSINTSLGIIGKIDLVLISSGTTAKYMAYGVASAGTTMTSRIINVTYSTSVAPTISLGASLYQENASARTIEMCRLVKSWNNNEAFLFYTSSNNLYVKTATISTDAITWGSETFVGSITGNYFDIMPAYVSSTNKAMMGVIYNSGNVTAFAVKNNA